MTNNKHSRNKGSLSSQGQTETLVEEMDEPRLSHGELLAADAERVWALEAEVARLDARLDVRTQQVRSLSRMLQEAEDTMQHWTSGMLHEGVQQVLYGMRLQVLSLTSYLSRSLPDAAKPEAEKTLQDLFATTEEMVSNIRSLTFMLAPPTQPDAMLPELLEALAQRMEELYGLEVEMVVSDSFRAPAGELPNGVGSALYRTLRSLLFYLVTVTDTRQAKMVLGMEGEMLAVRVSHLGEEVDFSHTLIETPETAGLDLIQERLQSAGGWLEMNGEQGPEALFILYLPLGALSSSPDS